MSHSADWLWGVHVLQSSGRAMLGLGAAWQDRELTDHRADRCTPSPHVTESRASVTLPHRSRRMCPASWVPAGSGWVGAGQHGMPTCGRGGHPWPPRTSSEPGWRCWPATAGRSGETRDRSGPCPRIGDLPGVGHPLRGRVCLPGREHPARASGVHLDAVADDRHTVDKHVLDTQREAGRLLETVAVDDPVGVE